MVPGIYDFDRRPPPPLTEAMLRAAQQRRAARRQAVLLALAGALFQAAAVLFALVYAGVFPLLCLALLCGVGLSAAGGGSIAVVYAQRKELHHE